MAPHGDQEASMQPTTQEPKVVDDAIKIIQEHLDREARNRRQSTLEPKDLCPMQKARLVSDLVATLDTTGGGSGFSRAVRSFWSNLVVGFRGRP
jgi:hypothetical protein